MTVKQDLINLNLLEEKDLKWLDDKNIHKHRTEFFQKYNFIKILIIIIIIFYIQKINEHIHHFPFFQCHMHT